MTRGLIEALRAGGFVVVADSVESQRTTQSVDVFLAEAMTEAFMAFVAAGRQPVVGITEPGDMAGVRAALAAGATSVLPLTNEADVVAVVTAAASNCALLPAEVARWLALRSNSPVPEELMLSRVEVDALRRLAEGATVATVASEQGYSEREMYRILYSTYRRLGAENRSEAIARSVRWGILDD